MEIRKCLFYLFLLLLSKSGYAQVEQIDSTQLERERIRWNRSLTKDTAYKFNKNPNQLLVESIKGKRPGKALDLGMGQGRNTIYLAKVGWDVTGIDIANEAVDFANTRAKEEKINIATELIPIEQFQFGVNKWDLIVHVYEGCLDDEKRIQKIIMSLKPRGIFVFEFFHREAGLQINRPDFGCISNSVKKIILKAGGLSIVRYSEEIGIADYGLKQNRLVKLVGVKK
ncbi:MAG: methyltransferase domain-containing protein [Chryseotalea sp. WA131a]|nr:MAG: methyltransferase domain-containing protein [Chryseotalea sp. WA131a]